MIINAKSIAGLLLGRQFMQSCKLLHGHLTANNVLFKANGMIQIAGCCVNRRPEPAVVNSGIR
jgi:hypothetical protein